MTEDRSTLRRSVRPRGGRTGGGRPGSRTRCEGRPGGRRLLAGDRGALTAEYAVLLPAAVLMLVAVLLAGAGAVQQVRNQDAAASAARVLARGDGEAAARSAAARMAGDGADVHLATGDGWATVTVTHAGPGFLAGALLSAEASAPLQPPPFPVRS
ncbi:TadE family type IV pilus minor pilin [Micrococcus lacusdianchii]|uniref:TadE family type IV pilus minor pilin n=1 Tax=Micrococcus lacusdianchii TaxID=2915940 RepID=UPI002004550C